MFKSILNIKVLIRVLGSLFLLEAIFLLLTYFVALYYNEYDHDAILITFGISFIIGAVSRFLTRNSNTEIGKREGYIIVSLVWIFFSIVGALPFYISGAIPSYTDAFFETMSGFTTTGASILNDIEAVPHALLFWRSLIQWMGGMGIIVLSLAVLPMLGIGGMQLFVAEVPGPTPDKLHPRIKQTAKRLWIIYLAFTVAEVILLLFGGMSFFDAVNHAFTTMATGGYSTKQDSVAFYQSPYIEYIISIFMFIAGMNFTLAYFGFKLKFKNIFKNEEFRYYLGFTLGFTLLIASILYFNMGNIGLEKAFRDSLFQVVSIMTTTGFATTDYMKWIPIAWVLTFVVMFIGGSAGSTGGGIKVIRVVLVIKNGFLEFKRLIHPNAIIPVRFNNRVVQPNIVKNILAFVMFYIFVFVTSTVIMSAMGLDLYSAMGAVIATLGNIGPGIGDYGPSANFYNIPTAGKWLLSFLMLVGRLELFTVLILFSPAFWK